MADGAGGEASEDPRGDLLYPEEEAEKPPEERSYIFETRLETSATRRLEGNELLKQGDLPGAISKFKLALYHVDFDEMSYNYELMDTHREAVDKARLPVYLNLALCLLKPGDTNDPVEACQQCTDALKLQPENVKALFRRGQGQLARNNLEEAKKDLLAAVKLAPKDKAIREAVDQLKEKMRDGKKKDKAVWGGSLLQAETETGTEKKEKKEPKQPKKETKRASAPAPVAGGAKSGETASATEITTADVLMSWPVAFAVLLVVLAFILTHKSVRSGVWSSHTDL